jgi:hypothetical protein
VLEFIASVTTGMKNLVDVLDQTFAKMSNMLKGWIYFVQLTPTRLHSHVSVSFFSV